MKLISKYDIFSALSSTLEVKAEPETPQWVTESLVGLSWEESADMLEFYTRYKIGNARCEASSHRPLTRTEFYNWLSSGDFKVRKWVIGGKVQLFDDETMEDYQRATGDSRLGVFGGRIHGDKVLERG